MASIMVSVHMLQFGESTIHRRFVAWVVFMKLMFSCVNRKPDDGFLPYRRLEVFNKIRHGLTYIIIA